MIVLYVEILIFYYLIAKCEYRILMESMHEMMHVAFGHVLGTCATRSIYLFTNNTGICIYIDYFDQSFVHADLDMHWTLNYAASAKREFLVWRCLKCIFDEFCFELLFFPLCRRQRWSLVLDLHSWLPQQAVTLDAGLKGSFVNAGLRTVKKMMRCLLEIEEYPPQL